MKTRFLNLALWFVGAFMLASCGGNSSSTTSVTPATQVALTVAPNAALAVSVPDLVLGAPNQVVIDTRSAALYAAGHIAGAINMPATALDTSPTSNALLSPDAAAALLGTTYGIADTNKIILYGANVDAGMGRIFWALEYLGAKDVHILDGGYAKWSVTADSSLKVTDATPIPLNGKTQTFTATVDAGRLASKQDVIAATTDPGSVIVDARPSKDYQAGHIPSAINLLPGDFLERDKTLLAYTKLKWLTDFTGAAANKKIIVYDTPGGSSAGAGQEYLILRLMGFDVRIYAGSWTEWNAATGYPNAGLLVDKGALAAPALVIDARSAAQYAAGHIPGAINVVHNDYWTAGAGLKPLATLEGLLGAAGISRSATIVIYDDTTASWGAAGRLFWMLEYLGCADVHILNGGWDKWAADASNVKSTTATTLPAATFTSSVQAARKLTGAQIKAQLGSAGFAVIDSRTHEEFNGWKFYGETRGGHIPGAFNLPYGAFYNADKTTLSYQSLKQMFESRGITTDKQVTAYCTAGIRSGYVYFLLRLMGYANASNYDASMFEWSAADAAAYPEEKAAHYQELVNADWVKSLIDYYAPGSSSAAPLEYTDANGIPYDKATHKYLILESSWGTPSTVYNTAHIPGAVHADTDPWETAPLYNLKDDATLQAHAGALGITADTTVVVYSDQPNFEARIWWLLKYVGVKDVRLIDGGYAAWPNAGYAGETKNNPPTPAAFSGTINSAIRATTAQALAHYADKPTPMMDDRGYRLYLGLYSGYSYTNIAGRIPGAVQASVRKTDADGTYASYTEVRSFYNSLGITADSDAWFYCGDGYGASQAFLMGYLMGYDKVRVYTDGWNTWSSVMLNGVQTPSGRPVASGLP